MGAGRQLYAHRGTRAGMPSRLFYASLFDTRPHEGETMQVDCTQLQDLLNTYSPTVVKIDAEGAERFILSISNFKNVRVFLVEWDWTHNPHKSCWDRTKLHLNDHGFTIHIRGSMPDFDDDGAAELKDAKGRKKG